eukprot:2062960-Pyramimonas_sp.AAC.1
MSGRLQLTYRKSCATAHSVHNTSRWTTVNAFHRYLQRLTTSSMARAVLDDLVQDNSYRSCLAEHYFGDKTRTEPVKILKDWRREHKVKRGIPDHPK